MARTGWLGVLVLAALGAGLTLRLRWPGPGSLLPCPADQVAWADAGEGGVAVCDPRRTLPPLPAAWARTLGQRRSLNRMTREELSGAPGVGRRLAASLVAAREARHGFTSWEQVDEVPGVGPAKLELLREIATLP